jgi:hypothetical protein
MNWKDWLRGLDSNQNSQIQSLESYQLDDPGVDKNSLAEARKTEQTRKRCARMESFC